MSPQVTRAPILAVALASVGAIIAAVAIIHLLGWMDSGLDLTDEAANLNLIRDPFQYGFTTTQYGFFYHPLYQLVAGDVALLRAVNVTVTVGLATGGGYLLLALGQSSPTMHGLLRVALALPFGLLALTCMVNWLATPDYNFMNLQGLLVSAIALLATANARDRAPLWAYAVLGVGGWMVFLAKPPTAVALALLAIIVLAAFRQLRPTGLAVAVATSAALVLASTVVIDGSPVAFAMRLADGATAAQLVDQRYGLLQLIRWDKLLLPDNEYNLLLWLSTGFAAVLLLAASDVLVARIIAVVLTLVALVTGVLNLVGVPLIAPDQWSDRYQLLLLAAPIGAGSAALVRLVLTRRINVPVLALAVVLMAIPYAFAIGTNGNYWWLGSLAAVFWVAAGICLLRSVIDDLAWARVAASAVLLPFSLVLALIPIGMNHPYRQTQPIRENASTISYGAGGEHRLVVSADLARYIGQLRGIADTNGLVSGTPVIDLTGHYPGALYLLGAKAVGRAWLIGGYPGSDDLAAMALGRVDCRTLAASWVLTELDGPRSISFAVLARYGLDYETVGTVQSPVGALPTPFKQELLKPAGDLAARVGRCVDLRG